MTLLQLKHLDRYLERRLDDWGEWLRKGNAVALGYPKQSIFARIADGKSIAQPPAFPASLEIDEEAEQIERLVVEMSHYNGQSAQALRFYYRGSLSLRAADLQCGISYSHMHMLMRSARHWLAAKLSTLLKLDPTA